VKYTRPDQLPATAKELNTLLEECDTERRLFLARKEAGDEFTEEDVARLTKLNADAKDITEARDAAVSNEQTHTERVDAALAEATKANAKAEPAPAAAPAAEAAPDPEPATAEPTEEQAAEVVAEAEAATEAAAEQPEAAVTAATPGGAAARTFAGAVTTGEPPKPSDADAGKPWSLVASAPNFAEHSGQMVDTATIAAGISSKSGVFTGIQAGVPTVLAKMERNQGPALKTRAEFYAELDRVTDPKELTAAGGWGSPSVQEYGFNPTMAAIGLLAFPSLVIERGGLIVPDEPDFTSLQTGFHYTEPELEAVDGGGDPTAIKDIVEIPAVDDMIEWRLEAIGWGVKSGILQTRAWPELIKKFLDEFLVAHQYRISAKSLLKVLAASSAAKVVPTDAVLGATTSILNGLHIRALNIQIKSRRPIVEGIAPLWFRSVLRADLANRDGLDVLNVTDAQVDGWLADRGIYLQYEGRWQSLGANQPGHEDNSWWPGSVDVVLYSAGAFWRAQDEVLKLGVQYPVEMVQQNRRLEGFVEDEFQVGKKPGFLSHLIRIPLCVNGAVGAREVIDCSGEYAQTKTATITTTGSPASGNFTLKFSINDRESGTINYNSSAANLKTAVVGIDDNFLAASFVAGGGALPTAVTLTYPAILGDLELGTNSLGGGSSPSVSISIA